MDKMTEHIEYSYRRHRAPKLKRALLSLASLLIIVAIVTTACFAWYYFEHTQSITIKSDAPHNVDFTLYKYDSETGRYTAATFNEQGDTLIASASQAVEFMIWGTEYLENVTIDDYYLLVLNYPEIYRGEYFKALINLSLRAGIDAETDLPHQRVRYTKMEYFVGSDADIDPTGAAAVSEGLSATAPYAIIDEDGNGISDFSVNYFDRTDTTTDLVHSQMITVDFAELAETQYTCLAGENTSNGIAVFFHLQTDSSEISAYLGDIIDDTLDLYFTIANNYEFSCSFVTVPKKTS